MISSARNRMPGAQEIASREANGEHFHANRVGSANPAKGAMGALLSSPKHSNDVPDYTSYAGETPSLGNFTKVLMGTNQARARDAANAGYQDDGSYKLNTNVTDEQAQEMAGRVSREQFERYMEMFAPQEQKMIDSLGENRAQDAGATAQADAARSRAALDRMRQRYGTSLTGQQQQAENSQSQRATTLGALSATNTGRQMDQDRKFNMQGTMLNIGNSLSSSSMSGLTDSSNNANARQQAHDQAKSQYKAQQAQQIGQAISTAGVVGALLTKV